MAIIIEKVLSYLRMKPTPFAKSIGVHPTQIFDIKSGKIKSISPAVAEKILAVYPFFSKLWLLTGEGEMLNPNVPEPKGTEEKSENDVVIEKGNKERVIPFYDVETTGGYNGIVSSSEEGALTGYIQPGGWFDGRETAAIRHVGDSMTEYPNGCVLAVREVKDKHLLVPGRNYVIETREYRVTKRVQHGSRENTIMLYSSNSEKYDDGRLIHEPFEVNLEDVLHIYSVLGYIVNQSGEFRLIKP